VDYSYIIKSLLPTIKERPQLKSKRRINIDIQKNSKHKTKITKQVTPIQNIKSKTIIVLKGQPADEERHSSLEV
jgi:hypothetical protein